MGEGHARLFGAFLGLSLGACGGAAPVVETTPVEREPIAAPAPEAPWGVRPLFAFGGVSRVSGSDAMELMLDGVRVAVDGDELRWAEQLTAEPMFCGTRVDGRYYFSTSSGAVYGADTFLGPLQLLRPGGPWLSSCLVRFGVHSVGSGYGDLLLVGPEDRVVELPDSLKGRLIDAAFRSPTLGVVVVAPGQALFTSDGERYQPIDVGGHAVLESWPEEDRWVLVTGGGPYAVDDQGRAEALEDEFEPTLLEVPEAVAERVRQAAIEREPLAWTRYPPGVGGRTLLVPRVQRAVYEGVGPRPVEPHLWSPADGLERLPPSESDAHCSFRDWGGRPVQKCGDDVSFYEEGEWRPIGSVDYLIAARDGSSLAALGGGAAGDEEPGTLRLFDGERWRHRAIGEGRTHLLDVSGDRVLVRRDADLVLLSVADPSADQTLDIGEGFRHWMVRFDADGGLWGMAQSEAGLVALRGERGGPVVPVVTPESTLQFRMVDARRGIALGRTLAQVWVTEDGAETWEPLELPIEGDPGSITIPGGTLSASTTVPCGVSGCVIASAVVWGSPQALQGAAPASTMRVPPRVEVDLPRWHETPIPRTAVSCPLEVESTGSGMAGYGSDGDESSLLGKVSVVDPHSENPRLRWSQQEGGRAFEQTSGPLPAPMVHRLRMNTGHFEALHLTRRLAIVDWCTMPFDTEEPDPPPVCGAPHRIRPGEAPEPLALELPEGIRPRFAGSLPLPSGRTALRWVHEQDYGPAIDLVAVVDRRGQVEARRLFLFPRAGFTRLLAVRGRDAGLAVGSPGTDTLELHALESSRESQPLGAYPNDPLPVCRRTPGRTGTVALGDAHLRIQLRLGGEGRSQPPGRYQVPLVALDGEQSCLAGFVPRPPVEHEMVDSPDPWLDVSIRRGTLRVRVIPREGAAGEPVSCEEPAAQ